MARMRCAPRKRLSSAAASSPPWIGMVKKRSCITAYLLRFVFVERPSRAGPSLRAPGALAPRRSAWGGPGAGRVALSCWLAGLAPNSGTAKAEVGDAEVGGVRAAERRPHVARASCPRTRRAGHGPRRRPANPVGSVRASSIVIPHAVLAPFPDIAEHVVQAPGIGLLELDRARPCLGVRVLLLRPIRTVVTVCSGRNRPRCCRHTRRWDRAPGRCARPGSPDRRCKCAVSVPARQAYSHCASLGSARSRSGIRPLMLLQKILRVVPTHLLHRPGRALEPARVLLHHRFPQRLGAGRVEQPVAFGQRDWMAGMFPSNHFRSSSSFASPRVSSSGEPIQNRPGGIQRKRWMTGSPAPGSTAISHHSPKRSRPMALAQAGLVRRRNVRRSRSVWIRKAGAWGNAQRTGDWPASRRSRVGSAPVAPPGWPCSGRRSACRPLAGPAGSAPGWPAGLTT